MNLNQTAFENVDYKKEGAIINLHLLPINRALVVRRAFDGLSQMELAAQLGIGQTVLSRIEQGKLAIGERLLTLVKKYVYMEEFEHDGL
ncbi:helix-turn-helix transcriptional regulator [Peribacillus sp. SI8-4]|uniref:helix-turn-helix domain-containing protein n=1 Tax=Peribacillus sp. SI8-4 TaxID=3048009 RepID=UPI002556B840|nr:helix-turn-helix transcriptional regulator [Peribacillus sp. SI8-4]